MIFIFVYLLNSGMIVLIAIIIASLENGSSKLSQ